MKNRKVTKSIKQIIYCCCAVLTLVSTAHAQNLPPKNPWLTDSAYPISHHNPGQTDVSPFAGPIGGHNLAVDDVKTVDAVFTCNPTWKNIGDDRIIFISHCNGVTKVLATGELFEKVSYLPYPTPAFKELQKKATTAAINTLLKKVDDARRAHDDAALLDFTQPVSDMGFNYTTVANGGYNMIDKDGNHYAVYDGVNVMKSTDDNKVSGPLRVVKTADITAALPPEVAKTVTRIMGINMTYDGHIVVGAPGMIALLDRELNVMDYMTFPGERVENNVAVDEKGIFVPSSKNMYKVVWTGKKLSFAEEDGGWVSPYDVMDVDKVMALGGLSHGTGTTPTLMGHGDDEDKLVLISDGNENGTQLVAFWRDEIPKDFKQKPGTKSRRIADQIPVDISYLTIEASPAVLGYGALLLNVTYPEPSTK